MAKFSILKGSTSVLVRVFIQDTRSTAGAGLTGLTNATSGLTCYVARDDDGNANATSLALAAGTRGTWSSGGFKEKDATNQPGVYELGLSNASLATGSRSATYYLQGAANMAPCLLEIELTATDNQSATGGLGTVNANVLQWNSTNVSAPATAGIPDVNVKNIDNDAASASGTVTFPNATLASTANITAGTITTVTNLTNAPSAGDFTAAMKTSLNAATPASVVGSVGSVTGLTASDVGAIKTKTDSLGFTVAGNVNCNVQYVNDVLVVGTGALGDEWGPV